MSHPSISEAENLLKKHRKTGVIILSVDISADGTSCEYASYGMDKNYCQVMGKIGDQIIEKICSGEIKP
jgi:hypothetical protein